MKEIFIITCGGTIDKIYFDAKSDFQVGEAQIDQVLEHSLVTAKYSILNLMQKDSLEMNDEDRLKVRESIEKCSHSRVLITHGTDTMIQTAKSLIDIKDKTIVLTGAMQPARFRESDAVFNIGGAFLATQTLEAGVYIAMNGQIFNPLHCKKNIELNRFESD